VQAGLTSVQHNWPLAPQGVHLPFLASVSPVQQVPSAQPRAQGVSSKPLPSARHWRTDVFSQVPAWVGWQALQARRAALHPCAQLSDVVPEPSACT
jgi:hypothetical protein